MNIAKYCILVSSGVLGSVVLFVQGCTLIGQSIGSSIDSDRPDRITVTSWQVDTLKAGTHVRVLLKDGSIVFGDHEGVKPDSVTGYRTRYDKYLLSGKKPLHLPGPGDSVLLVLSPRAVRRAEVTAYDYNGMYFGIWSQGPFLIRYASIDTLLHEGVSWSGEELRQATMREEVPMSSLLIVRGPSKYGYGAIPLSEIHSISYATTKNGRIIGGAIGALVDATVVISLVVSSQQHQSSYATGHSCPFVYSFDGDGYVFDSETFSGAICPALQRTDWDDLEQLVMVNGSCSLRVENHLPETQYVDALKLIVVDHPQGSRVIAGAPGEIHTVFEPQRPVEAVDDRGNVVLPLLARADSLSWISDPIGRDPEDPAAVRDGLTLAFDVAQGSDSAKLILSARNTFWAAELEERLLKLQGTDLDRWYEAMESSREFRDSFVDIVRREAMLSVQIWTGESVEAGAIPRVPGAIPGQDLCGAGGSPAGHRAPASGPPGIHGGAVDDQQRQHRLFPGRLGPNNRSPAGPRTGQPRREHRHRARFRGRAVLCAGAR